MNNEANEILKVIAQECCHGCADEFGTFAYFTAANRYRGKNYDMNLVRVLAKIVNYAAIRENEEFLLKIFSGEDHHA